MRRLRWVTIPLYFATGCARVAVNDSALCTGLERPVAAHAAALAEDAGSKSVVTGARLIRMIDAGCGRQE